MLTTAGIARATIAGTVVGATGWRCSSARAGPACGPAPSDDTELLRVQRRADRADKARRLGEKGGLGRRGGNAKADDRDGIEAVGDRPPARNEPGEEDDHQRRDEHAETEVERHAVVVAAIVITVEQAQADHD